PIERSAVSVTRGLLCTLSHGSGSATIPGQKKGVTLSQFTTTSPTLTDTMVHKGTLTPTTSSASGSTTTPAHDSTPAPTTRDAASGSATTTVHNGTFTPTTRDASGSGVPGWGIALLVLVCVLVTLAIVYFIALAVCQCRRKNYGQLDIFPTRDAYHPMSEYPTYHTHGRYVPPGSTKRSPYEEISSGNGGSGLSYTNPAAAVTSANL
uniref:Mucin-1 n=1 Tax=Castor canadensis TaxID=51338 RepID=A0A8C0X9Y8_CASCN